MPTPARRTDLGEIHGLAVVAVCRKVLPQEVAWLAEVVVARAHERRHVKAQGGANGVCGQAGAAGLRRARDGAPALQRRPPCPAASYQSCPGSPCRSTCPFQCLWAAAVVFGVGVVRRHGPDLRPWASLAPQFVPLSRTRLVGEKDNVLAGVAELLELDGHDRRPERPVGLGWALERWPRSEAVGSEARPAGPGAITIAITIASAA